MRKRRKFKAARKVRSKKNSYEPPSVTREGNLRLLITASTTWCSI